MIAILVIFGYLALLLLVGRLVARRSSNEAFFRGERRSPWYIVAWGMIGASISGVTFVSVPGMVVGADMTYLQMCLGFIPGYFAVAFVLLPVYYRLNLTTIYTFLERRLGRSAYKTGASFFLLSKIAGTVVKFYLFCILLQRFVLDAMDIPFAVTVPVLLLLVWLYTRRGGIKTLVWTDTIQTTCMLLAVGLIITVVSRELFPEIGTWQAISEAVKAVAADSHSRMFEFGDWTSRQYFWKQFLSGIFIVIVMTGLDQDMMQKNLTCKNLRDAQKDMCSYGMAFVPVNLLFLALGVLLTLLAAQRGLPLPEHSDDLLPMFAATGSLGHAVVVFFVLGIVAASFSTADSAMTALTTTFCVDVCERPHDERLRRRAHFGLAIVLAVAILAFHQLNSTTLIDAVYTLVSYTYGPLLGLFAFALLTKKAKDSVFSLSFAPYVCVAAPLLCFAIDRLMMHFFGYRFGYELLVLNGLLTFVGLWIEAFWKRKSVV